MISKRWNVAQSYEREYWKQIADKIAADAGNQLTWYDWKASEFGKKIANVTTNFNKKDCRILEVGSGPIGIVSYLKWGERYAIDPLSDFYKENPLLVTLRDANVNYITGKGEEIPFPDGHFSIVILDNVLDHVSAPGAVLREIHRVLAANGLLYMELNIHTFWGYLLHSALASLNIDKGHPYSFTTKKIRHFIEDHQFVVKWEFVNDYYAARRADRDSSSLKAKIKGYSGLSEFIYSAVCSKEIIRSDQKKR